MSNIRLTCDDRERLARIVARRKTPATKVIRQLLQDEEARLELHPSREAAAGQLAAKGTTIAFCPKRHRWVLLAATKARSVVIEREVAQRAE